jgi:hypothetical protein
VYLFGNARICASTVLERSCCRIHSYVAAPQKHPGLYRHIDTKAFDSVSLKQDRRWVQRHSLFLSADPPSSAVFLGVVNFVLIQELVAIETRIESEKY